MGASTEGILGHLLRALADPTRRRILRQLAIEPGATTSDLAHTTPGVTRWAVMKHLAVLRKAGLIQTLPEGRRRRHFRVKGALAPLADWVRSTEFG